MKKKFGKLNYGSIVKNTVAVAAGGVVASVVDNYITTATTNMLLKGGVGLIVPLVVKDETVGRVCDSLLAVTAYQASKLYLIPKLTSTVSGSFSPTVGAASNWIEAHARPVTTTTPVSGTNSDVLVG